MEDYIEQIERFLIGQMTEQEEHSFNTLLRGDFHLRSLAFLLVNILRSQNYR